MAGAAALAALGGLAEYVLKHFRNHEDMAFMRARLQAFLSGGGDHDSHKMHAAEYAEEAVSGDKVARAPHAHGPMATAFSHGPHGGSALPGALQTPASGAAQPSLTPLLLQRPYSRHVSVLPQMIRMPWSCSRHCLTR